MWQPSDHGNNTNAYTGSKYGTVHWGGMSPVGNEDWFGGEGVREICSYQAAPSWHPPTPLLLAPTSSTAPPQPAPQHSSLLLQVAAVLLLFTLASLIDAVVCVRKGPTSHTKHTNTPLRSLCVHTPLCHPHPPPTHTEPRVVCCGVPSLSPAKPGSNSRTPCSLVG